MFIKEGFTPVSLQGGPRAPRIFSYANTQDTLEEMSKPGYFNVQKMILLPNAFVKFVAKDAFGEFVVKKNTGDVTMHDKFLSVPLLQPRNEGGKFISNGTKPKKVKKPRKKLAQSESG